MKGVKNIRALERGLAVLGYVREFDALRLSELHSRTKLPRATLLRALKTLEENGWVQLDGNGCYRPGAKMFYERADRARQTLQGLVVPILNELCRKVAWPSDMGVCRGRSIVILESSRRNSPLVINRHAVGRKPSLLKSAMGRAYLAFCSPSERERLLDLLARSTHPDDKIAKATSLVSRILRETRARGYGVREPGYWAEADDYGAEVSSIAVPVVANDSVVACISLLWVSSVCSVEEFAKPNLKLLKEAAETFAYRIEEHGGASVLGSSFPSQV